MATPPDKSKSASRFSVNDPFMEPLPVPEASESDTDTAWGLWEHTLRAHEGEAQTPPEHEFQETLPAELTPLPRKP